MQRKAMIRHLTLVSLAALLALVFTDIVLSYYRSYHFGVGAAYGLAMMGLPVAFVIALVTGYVTHYVAGKRGATHAAVWSVVAMIGVLAVIFAAHWASTSGARERDRSASIERRLTYAAADWRVRASGIASAAMATELFR